MNHSAAPAGYPRRQGRRCERAREPTVRKGGRGRYAGAALLHAMRVPSSSLPKGSLPFSVTGRRAQVRRRSAAPTSCFSRPSVVGWGPRRIIRAGSPRHVPRLNGLEYPAGVTPEASTEQESAMAKVLVTGGAGFIGSALVSRLIDGGSEVVVADVFTLRCTRVCPHHCHRQLPSSPSTSLIALRGTHCSGCSGRTQSYIWLPRQARAVAPGSKQAHGRQRARYNPDA